MVAEREYPEGNDEVESKGPCPKCDTEFGNVTYRDGHSHCFSCGHSARGGERAAPEPRVRGGNAGLLRAEPGAFEGLRKRGLSSTTLRKFGYFVAGFKEQSVQVAPYYDTEGNNVAQKLRLPNKEFVVLYGPEPHPSISKCRPFGYQVWGDKHDKRIVITEGELDAMSVAQATDFKFPCVSVNTGSKGAAACLKANYLWVDRFDEIVLWFDDDEPGKAAAEECAQLFKVGKVKIAKAPGGLKDASDVLQANRPGDILSCVFGASAWRPAGIVNAADNSDDVCAPKEDDVRSWSFFWPWRSWNEYLGPLLPGQVTYHVAGTGIGKSSALAEIEYCLLQQGCKVAHLGFEDTRRDVKLRLMGVAYSERFDITPRSDEEMRAMHDQTFGSHRLELFDPETAEWTVDAILGYVRYCAKALDCQVLVVDPLTFIAAGLAVGDDERRALDKASRDLAAMAKELAVNIQVAHHLTRPEGIGHEEGASTSIKQIRGSGGMANFASSVIGHERNQQADGESVLLTQTRALKNRARSKTGIMNVLAYSMETGRLLPTDKPFPGTKKGAPSHTSFGSTDF